MKIFSLHKFAFTLLTALLFLAGMTNVSAAPGDIDPTFNTVVPGLNNGAIAVIEKQPDGKFLLGGTFLDVNGHATTAVARLNADGTIDTTFSSPDFGNGTGVGGSINAIGVQSDGKIVVGGEIYGVNGVAGRKMYRLNPNGSLDTTFQCPVFDTNMGPGFINSIKIQSDDKIVAGGDFGIGAAGAASRLVRLNADGSVDNNFANFSTVGIIFSLEIQPDGKILTGGTSLVRRTTDGSNDPTFSGVSTSGFGSVFAIELSPDGKIFIGGQFSNLNGTTIRNLAKVNMDGSLDLNFNLNGLGPNDFVSSILALKDGKLIISGYFTTYNATPQQKIARLNFDGSLDTSLQSTPAFFNFYAKDAELFDDGKILLGGNVQANATTPTLNRLNTDGTIDTSISYVVSNIGRVREILQQPDGKILIAGLFAAVNGVRRSSVARLNADGTLDTTFVPYFNTVSPPPRLNAIALQADGKIVIGGEFGVFRRMNSDGSQDTSFSSFPLGGNANTLDIQIAQDGRIIVGGDLTLPNANIRKIVRLNTDGTNDTTFGVDQPNSTVNDMQIQPDGKIIIGGAFTQVGLSLRGKFARLTSEGVLDATFNPPGGAGSGNVFNVELQPDGKILLGGSFTSLNTSANQIRVGRVNADGTLDASFAQSVNGTVNTMKLQPDGKVLIGGSFTAVNGVPKVGLARLNANGSLDNPFTATVVNGISDIQLQADGKILIGGDFVKVNGVSRIRIARLINGGAVPRQTPFDYDGDGKADISVFRASENKWYILQSSNYVLRENVFAIAGDVPVPADYDGDLKTDIAIYRPSTGTWWYLSSISGAQIAVVFGLPDGIPRPSDFDGDGKTDFVFYRPADSKWYRMTATGVVAPQFAFGIAEDKPLIADFDGDGKSEPAVFRPSTGDWWYATSVPGQFAVVHWGAAGDIPVPADVDADGKTDFVVYRPSNGGWYILRSGEQNYTILQFGTAEDKPVMADYDGDGKADVGVFRPSNGTWYLLQTTSGFGAVQWGNSLDTATPNAFLP